jgi:hypothetical protein
MTSFTLPKAFFTAFFADESTKSKFKWHSDNYLRYEFVES